VRPLPNVGPDDEVTVTSEPFAVDAAGTYQWIASYSGDADNEPVSGACGDDGETSTVAQAQPQLSTSATSTELAARPLATPLAPSSTVTDTATLTGLDDGATGTVRFSVWGPQEVGAAPSCTGAPLQVFAGVPLTPTGTGTATAASPPLTVQLPGAYHWVARYTGDADNAPAAGACGDAGETSVVLQPVPELAKNADPPTTTAAPTTVPRGRAITYTVTVRNTGTGTLVGDAVDTVPATVSTPASVTGGGVWSPAQRTLTWSGVSLAAGQSATFSYAVTVLDTAPAGELPNDVAFLDRQARTVHLVGVPTPTLTKTADRSEGSTVAAGDRITWTVVAGNTGSWPVAPAVVVDRLPAAAVFTLDPTSVTDGGVVDTAAGTITWTVASLAPGETVTRRYSGTVEPVTAATDVVNVATFEGLSRSTLHVARPGGLSVNKAVSPSSGVVQPGDTLTYTMTVAAAGELVEPGVVVRDVVPGRDPARPSGATTYVTGSARCDTAGPCEVAYDAGTGTVTWGLGELVPGSPRMVSFAVVVDVPAVAGTPVADVVNAATATSTRTPATPSNQVVTPVTSVLAAAPAPSAPPAVSPPPAVTPRALPFTGAWLLPALSLGTALSLVGALLVGLGGRRSRPRHGGSR
jgi:uncharacterized repeat protein (TIGR01451 family)